MNTLKKVAFILPRLGTGGAERVLITLMNTLNRAEFDPVLITVSAEGELRSWVSREIEVIDLGYPKVSLGLFALWKSLRKMQPDIIVSTMVHMNLGVMLVYPFLKKKSRLIIREAIVPSFFFNQIKFPALMKMLYRIFYPQADLVISPAQIIIDEFKDIARVSTRNHVLLYNPVDISRIRSSQTLQRTSSHEAVNFICAGRLHHQKGFDQLIEALPYLNMARPWTITILGEGEERENLMKLILKHGLEGRVFMPGVMQNPWPSIAAADCFLLPSRWEGLPNVVLESLAVGTPVIATISSGGIAEIERLAPEHVTIVDDMPGFIDAMRFVQPIPASAMRPSLLPDTFKLENVTARFRDLLLGNPVEDHNGQDTSEQLKKHAAH